MESPKQGATELRARWLTSKSRTLGVQRCGVWFGVRGFRVKANRV